MVVWFIHTKINGMSATRVPQSVLPCNHRVLSSTALRSCCSRASVVCYQCALFCPGMYIFPLPELLDVAMHASPGVAISFQEEVIIDGKREQECTSNSCG